MKIRPRCGVPGNIFDPQSIHRYVYVHGDPVNAADPTGQIIVGSNWLYGDKVHDYIGNHFLNVQRIEGNIAYYDQTINTILGGTYLWGSSRPDLVVKTDSNGSAIKEVYEIKPTLSAAAGYVQLAWYLTLLNAYNPSANPSWHAGAVSTYAPPSYVPISWGVFAIVQPPLKGLIVYQVYDLRQALAFLALYFLANIETDVATATANALRGHVFAPAL